MPYDIEHEQLGTVLSYAGIALDQLRYQSDLVRTALLQESFDKFNMQLYSTGRIAIGSEEEEAAFFALTDAVETYLKERYDRCVASDGPQSGFAKQLREDVAVVEAFLKSIGGKQITSTRRDPQMRVDDAVLMLEIVNAITRSTPAGKNALIDDRLGQEMRLMLLKLVRERLDIV